MRKADLKKIGASELWRLVMKMSCLKQNTNACVPQDIYLELTLESTVETLRYAILDMWLERLAEWRIV